MMCYYLNVQFQGQRVKSNSSALSAGSFCSKFITSVRKVSFPYVGVTGFPDCSKLRFPFRHFPMKTHGTLRCIRPKVLPSKSLSTRLCDYIPMGVNAAPIVCKLIKRLSLREMQYPLQSTDWRCDAAHARRTQYPTTVSCHLWCGVKCVALTMSLTAAYGNWCVWPSARANVSRLPFVQHFIVKCLPYLKKPEQSTILVIFQNTVKYTIDAS